MFGYVIADLRELTPEQKERYNRIYCGICRRIRIQSSRTSRLGLSNDMAFLAMLLMSLYEPEETSGEKACGFHPVKPRSWVDSPIISYAADMNVALAYYNAQDNWLDDRSLAGRLAAGTLKKHLPAIGEKYPRQCEAMESCIAQIARLEKDNTPDPDAAAGCFGKLLGELLVYREDMWSETLRKLGYALGRFIYLADAASDYRKDLRRGSYNPFVAGGIEDREGVFEKYLVMAMSRCTRYYESLPLVQDKDILDNMLYSGVWVAYRSRRKEPKETGGTTHGGSI